MSTALTEPFKSVRNAYRLLNDYHRRVLDTVRLARDGLDNDPLLGVKLKLISWRPYGLPDPGTDILNKDPPMAWSSPSAPRWT
jgi:hypothetical protein